MSVPDQVCFLLQLQASFNVQYELYPKRNKVIALEGIEFSFVDVAEVYQIINRPS